MIVSVTVLTAALAGCGGSESPTIPTAGGSPTGSESASADASGFDDEQMLKYTHCLREQGVDVEDPKPGQGVRIQGKEDDQAFAEAMEACEDLAPPGAAEEPEGAHEEMLKAARCMREHGVEGFPDPQPGQGISIDQEVAEDPDFEQAEKDCIGALEGGREEAP